MLKTLGLDDDLDSVELMIVLEKVFDTKISDEEAKVISKVGHLFDLLMKKMSADDVNRKCASAMAFYRVRRALIDMETNVGRSPSSGLSPLQSLYTKSFVRLLEECSGLRLPRPAFSFTGKMGNGILVAGIFSALVTIILGFIFVLLSSSIGEPLIAASIILFVGGSFMGCTLMGIDQGCLPSSCLTLGALASKAAHMSYGRLVKQGANIRDSSVWKAMVEALSDFTNVSADQITRDTYLLRSALKNVKAAA